jgi:hypothetical protein
MAKPKFTPFPEPKNEPDADGQGGDLPLVTPAGVDYRCSGCGTIISSRAGFWITENIEDGMVTGMSMRIGADGPVLHACGTAA